MFRYQNNAFRILGLKPNASMKEITKRVNEIKVKISLGMNVEYDYDFTFMGPINRDEQNILNALQRLENPILRLKEEIFWFWFETDSDIEAISYLAQNNRNGAHNIWDVQLTEGNFTEKSISAYWNQIILAHSTIIEEESKEYNTVLEKISTLNENHWKNWQVVIDRLILLAKNNLFWDMVQKKAERVADPRLSKIKVNEIRNNFLNDIVQPNFSLISQALNKKDFSTIEKHLNLFYDNFIPDDSKIPTEVLREGFNKILASHTNFLNDYTRNAEKELRKIEKEKNDIDQLVVLIINLYHRIVKNVANIIYEGNLVDPNNISDFSLAKDRTAEVIRICAVRLFNSLIDNQSYKERQYKLFKSYIMIRKAIEYSGTYHSSKRIGEDEENIKRYLEYTFGYYKFTDIYNKIQEQENNYERIMQKKEEEQGTIKEDIEEEKKSKFDWTSMLIYGIIVLFFIVIFNLPFDSNDKTTNTTNTQVETSSYSFNNDQNQLEVMIDELEDELKIKERRLEEMTSKLETSQTTISNLELELVNLESKINNTYLQNDKNRLIDEYNQIYEHYDKLYSSYEDTYLEYEKLYEEYEGEISLYNTLVDSYKTGSMPSLMQENQVDSEIEFTIYTVKAGDSLSKIAKNFNTTVEIIAKQNNLNNLNIIRPGQKLIIPQ